MTRSLPRNRGRRRPRGPARGAIGAVVVLVLAAGAAGCRDAGRESSERGDRLLAAGEIDAAIAEYKLAVRQQGESPEALLRLGHAYALAGDVDEASRYYAPLLERDSSYRYQVAADLAEVSRGALARGQRENMARALQPLLEWSFDLIPEDLRLPLAGHAWEEGDYALALPLYLTVLEESADGEGPEATVYYETARAFEELGGCARALEYFEAYLSRAERSAEELAGAEWHYGSCLFEESRADRSAGRPGAALDKLDRMVELGVPQTLMDRAHFNRGELMLALGDEQGALAAYEEVLRLNPARSGPLVQRAERRIRQIRFEHD